MPERKLASYLLTWNPARWPWAGLEEDIATLRHQGYLDGRWSCAVTKRIAVGDRLYLMRLGALPKGIVASGVATSDVYEEPHWDPPRRAQGRMAKLVDIRWDALLDAREGRILSLDVLRSGPMGAMNWTPRGSGVRIPEDVAASLAVAWDGLLFELGVDVR